LGSGGGGLGYAGVDRSLAIEFDTFKNSDDINDNHVSVLVNGVVTDAIATEGYDGDLNDGTDKFAWVEYDGSSNVLTVYVSETNSKPSEPLIETDIDLSSLVGDQAYAGFSAGTGGLYNNHDVLSWSLNAGVPVSRPVPTQLTVIGDTLFFTADNGVNGRELWSFDGSDAKLSNSISCQGLSCTRLRRLATWTPTTQTLG